MTGPRVTSGKDSKQDYGTPGNLLAPVQQRLGPIVFDLAAHRLNKVHERYFAPKYFTDTWNPNKIDIKDLVDSLVNRGANEDEAMRAVYASLKYEARVKQLKTPNYDPEAHSLDAFKWSWSLVHRDYGPGLLWLNCEFSDVTPWAQKCQLEAAQGAHIALLTPMVMTDWYVRYVAGSADVYQLSGRVSFDGKHPFPKDCMVSHFHPKATGALAIWDWRQDRILERWHLG